MRCDDFGQDTIRKASCCARATRVRERNVWRGSVLQYKLDISTHARECSEEELTVPSIAQNDGKRTTVNWFSTRPDRKDSKNGAQS